MDSGLIDQLAETASRFGRQSDISRTQMTMAARWRQEAILGLQAEGLSVRAIASRLGVSHSVVQSALQTARARRPARSRREDRFPYELHVLLGSKVAEDPDRLRALARENLARMRETPKAPIAQRWLDRWSEIICLQPHEMVDVMLEDSEQGRDLRQVSPFAGALTPEDRTIAMKKARVFETV